MSIDSAIVAELPAIFSRFQSSEFHLLYRATRDGFQSTDFHRCSDGHSGTLTLVLSTAGYIFGGYTPLVWSSRGAYVTDPSRKSFLFTIKNPHGLEPHIFAQKDEASAIYDNASDGPTFGANHDLYVCTQCHTQNNSYSTLGNTYTNDTGIAGTAVLTGEKNFFVKEIEVFEVSQAV
jgi:hypothetical protein